MNTSDALRTEGFLVALSVRGRTMRVGAMDGPAIDVLVQTAKNADDEFEISPDVATVANIALLRSSLRAILSPAATVSGITFYDVANYVRYRVMTVRDQPADIAIRFTCQVSPLS